MPAETKRLPGMEDSEIEEIEVAAHDYFKKRNARQKKTVLEVESKTTLLEAMKKHKKKTYRHGDLEIEIVVSKEKLKVRIANEKDSEDE